MPEIRHSTLFRAEAGKPAPVVRRPRAGFASLLPGGPGSPSAGTRPGCLKWLDAVWTKGAKAPGSGRVKSPSVRHPEARSRGQKSRNGASKGARVLERGRGNSRTMVAPLGAPFPSHLAGERKGTTAYPGPPKTRALSLACFILLALSCEGLHIAAMAEKNVFAIAAIVIFLIVGVFVAIGIVGTIAMLLYSLVAFVFSSLFGIELPRLY